MSSEASSQPLNESLDYGHAHLEYEARAVAATARRLPGQPFSNLVAHSDLPAKEDQP